MNKSFKERLEEQYHIYMHDPDLLPEFIEAIIGLLESSVEEWMPEKKGTETISSTKNMLNTQHNYTLSQTEENFREWLSAGDTNVTHKEGK